VKSNRRWIADLRTRCQKSSAPANVEAKMIELSKLSRRTASKKTLEKDSGKAFTRTKPNPDQNKPIPNAPHPSPVAFLTRQPGPRPRESRTNTEECTEPTTRRNQNPLTERIPMTRSTMPSSFVDALDPLRDLRSKSESLDFSLDAHPKSHQAAKRFKRRPSRRTLRRVPCSSFVHLPSADDSVRGG